MAKKKTINNYSDTNITKTFRLYIKKTDETSFWVHIKQRHLMSKKHKKSLHAFKLHWAITYIVFDITTCISIRLVSCCFFRYFASSALEEKTCAGTTWIKKHKSMIRK